MIGKSLVRLLRHPDQFTASAADAALGAGAVDEILRLDSAISLTKVVPSEAAALASR